MFDLTFLAEENIDGELYAKCKITIDDYSEELRCPLSYWKLNEYQSHWRSQLESFMLNDEKFSFIVSEMYDPSTANFIKCWLFYKLDGFIKIQENIFFSEDFDGHISLSKIEENLGPIELVDEDGDEISTWTLPESKFRSSSYFESRK